MYEKLYRQRKVRVWLKGSTGRTMLRNSLNRYDYFRSIREDLGGLGSIICEKDFRPPMKESTLLQRGL